ncbi:hypothetical protein [Nostoc sp. NMS9]|uniref:hypothetical protein n=1 Tax=Nostoc sp. NMS9 TaxID=2815393 RepID=UPI0025F1587B|nr:hypothetical protein [Nostoc sp. NMS9]MBN3944235.1 hypothetical protein [Nostoc sp. NMS9]
MPSPFYLLFRFITPESSLAIQDGDRTEVIREYQALTTIGNKYLIPNAIHQENKQFFQVDYHFSRKMA